MSPDTLWLIAVAALFVVGCAACYWLGYRAGHEQGTIDASRRVERWASSRERAR